MNTETYHILNGDALKQQFPGSMVGDTIIMRECLVDGDVSGESLKDFFEARSAFLSASYGATADVEYSRDVVTEFERMMAIPSDAEVNVWFEDDLFCQVNFWFVAHLLTHYSKQVPKKVYLVRPPKHTPYGFGGLNENELIEAYERRIPLDKLDTIARLWEHYRYENTEALISQARELEKEYPFMLPAVQAHLERIPTDTYPGRPVQVLRDIMEELQTRDFGTIFRAFNARESIYGFGDLQVKRMYDDLIQDP